MLLGIIRENIYILNIRKEGFQLGLKGTVERILLVKDSASRYLGLRPMKP